MTATQSPERTPEQTVVAARLHQAGDRMKQAISALEQAARMSMGDIVKGANTDPAYSGDEEVHVRTGLNALMDAVECASDAYNGTVKMGNDRESQELRNSAQKLNESFRVLLTDLHRQPEHRLIVAQLKQARNLIPKKMVKQLTKG